MRVSRQPADPLGAPIAQIPEEIRWATECGGPTGVESVCLEWMEWSFQWRVALVPCDT